MGEQADCRYDDDKTGYSSMCRRGDHTLCVTAGATCKCPGHGPNGQQAPARPIPQPLPERKTVVEETPTPPKEEPKSGEELPCPADDCGRTFGTQRGLSKHYQSMHGGRVPGTDDKPAKPPKVTAAPSNGHVLVPDRVALAILADIVQPRMEGNPTVGEVIDFAGEIVDGLRNASVLLLDDSA